MAIYNDLFKITHNNIIPEQGRILISEPFLQDVYFQRSVILLIEHDQQGSLGLILNKKTDLTVNTFFAELNDYAEMPIFLGGPVCADHLFFIHTLGDEIISDSVPVDNHIYFGGNFDDVVSYIKAGHPVSSKIKFFLGYSGWTENQLKNEITKDSWVVSKTNYRKALQAEGEDFWKQAVISLGHEYLNWIKYPKDPYLN